MLFNENRPYVILMACQCPVLADGKLKKVLFINKQKDSAQFIDPSGLLSQGLKEQIDLKVIWLNIAG